jgi:hypothetical protein
MEPLLRQERPRDSRVPDNRHEGSFILWLAKKVEFRAPSEVRRDHRITGDTLPDYQTVCGIFVCLWCAALRNSRRQCGGPDNPLAGVL